MNAHTEKRTAYFFLLSKSGGRSSSTGISEMKEKEEIFQSF